MATCTDAVPVVLAGKLTIPEPPPDVVTDVEVGVVVLICAEDELDAEGAGTLMTVFVPPQPTAASSPLQARHATASRPYERA
jgi:hypothetical protein